MTLPGLLVWCAFILWATLRLMELQRMHAVRRRVRQSQHARALTRIEELERECKIGEWAEA